MVVEPRWGRRGGPGGPETSSTTPALSGVLAGEGAESGEVAVALPVALAPGALPLPSTVAAARAGQVSLALLALPERRRLP